MPLCKWLETWQIQGSVRCQSVNPLDTFGDSQEAAVSRWNLSGFTGDECKELLHL